MARFRRSDESTNEFYDGAHKFEHWYRDNSIYFITARCRGKFPPFDSEQVKSIFWDRFLYYTQLHLFVPIITTLMNNHYHVMGYKKFGADLGEMMRKIHGSVAKLVNDVLPVRHVPFWGEGNRDNYMDGCLRDELQYRRTFRYVRLQAVKAGIVSDYRLYPHTRINVPLEIGLKRAIELNAFLEEVPYKRYEKWRSHRNGRELDRTHWLRHFSDAVFLREYNRP